MKYDLVIFDLDGTLLDTSEGIFNSVRYAECKMEFKNIPEEDLKLFIGPPPKEMYKKIYDLDDSTAMEAARYHREYSKNGGMYEAVVYSGVKETLSKLKKEGVKAAIATLKSQEIAEAILNHFGLAEYMNVIVGMNSEENLTKCEIIKRAIALANAKSSRTVMVGDSQYDFDGAEEAGIDFIGVLYGFGFTEETDSRSWKSALNTINELVGAIK